MTLILRSRADFPEKIEEMQKMYPSKEIAMMKVDHAIDYLHKVRLYRQYTESDDMFHRQVVLHMQLKKYLENTPDWKIEPEVKPSIFSKAFNLITTWHVQVLLWTVNQFPKLFARIRKKALAKHADLKRKNLI
ncbi:hypothetical protein UFOVP1247_9 [uncultured Caudovirales phage]|jgi:hypothetical protein|uniref:Uncharacterized protein n=1 Tax=uncultured Caudovirales phage TaxID=2100421 RepID=A0A6J5PZ90_9CAUD|nr:hypothetical protein UFOVP970_49 [uncultured Caudovirales phage]CAB4193037.1 hypothetical protein UFOVP1247_9 [uncultured Caudovirales phage]